MDPGALILLASAGGVITALAPLIYLFYYTKPVTYTVWSGAIVSFIAGFVFTLLVVQWGFFYARFTYLLALGLLAIALGYTYWGMFKRRWTMYLFAAAVWIYLILLAVIARALGLPDPFII